MNLEQCQSCHYHETKDIKDVEAFDCGDLKKTVYDTIDYCHSLQDKCNPEICEYRIIEVPVYQLSVLRQLIAKSLIKNKKKTMFETETIELETAIEYVDEILKN